MGTDINFKNHLGRTYGTRIGLPAFDPAAQAYFSATGITGATQQAAIDNLVKGLKADGIWSKMKAVYPFVTDNYNVLSYTEAFGGVGWEKVASTVTSNTTTAPNGTLTADTLTENTSNSEHLTRILVNNLSPSTTYTNSIYVKYNNRQFVMLAGYFNSGAFPVYLAKYDIINGTVTSQSASSGGTIISSSIENVGNGWFRISVSGQVGANSNNIAFQLNLLDDSQNQSYIGTGKSVYIWGAQLELGSTATDYQPIATTQQAYIASQFKYNLVNPVDSDAAFRLVFNGGWTHSSNGATPNGTNGYADTKLSTSALTNNSTHISYYSRSATSGSTRSEIGGGDPATNVYLQMLSYRLTGNYNGDQYYGAAALNRIDVAVADSRGYFIDSRTNSSTHKAWKSNVLIGSESNLQTNNISSFSQNIYIGGRNNGGSADLFSDRQSAFATIGNGLLDAEASALYNRVQNFQLALSRNV